MNLNTGLVTFPFYFTIMKWEYWLLFFVIAVVIKLSLFTKKLTTAAAFTGGLLAICIYIGAGFTGIAMMAVFFVLGTAATSWQNKRKQTLQIEEENNGQRKAGQVIANAGAASLASLLVYFFPQHTVLLQMMMASSFSSATADTLSSELGNVYGKRFYNILSLRKDERGLDGVISLEGTCIGVCGSIIIAFLYIIGFERNLTLFFIIVLSGTIGNLSDSLLGAAFERKDLLQNDAVNFLNTIIAALFAFLLFKWL